MKRPAADRPAAASGPAPRRRAAARRHALEPPSRRTLFALFCAGVLLVPACSGAMAALRAGESLFGGGPFRVLGLSGPLASFLAGAVAFAMAYFLVRIPPPLYIAVHEATHAVFGWLFGARVSRFRVGEEHGSVDVSRTNAVILLAPYFFPLPAFALLALFGLCCAAAPLRGTAAGALFACLCGAAWSFHLCFTANALLQPQTDLDAYGFFFSCVLLFFLNAVLLYFTLLAFGTADLGEGLSLFSDSVVRAYRWLWDGVRSAGAAPL